MQSRVLPAVVAVVMFVAGGGVYLAATGRLRRPAPSRAEAEPAIVPVVSATSMTSAPPSVMASIEPLVSAAPSVAAPRPSVTTPRPSVTAPRPSATAATPAPHDPEDPFAGHR